MFSEKMPDVVLDGEESQNLQKDVVSDAADEDRTDPESVKATVSEKEFREKSNGVIELKAVEMEEQGKPREEIDGFVARARQMVDMVWEFIKVCEDKHPFLTWSAIGMIGLGATALIGGVAELLGVLFAITGMMQGELRYSNKVSEEERNTMQEELRQELKDNDKID